MFALLLHKRFLVIQGIEFARCLRNLLPDDCDLFHRETVPLPHLRYKSFVNDSCADSIRLILKLLGYDPSNCKAVYSAKMYTDTSYTYNPLIEYIQRDSTQGIISLDTRIIHRSYNIIDDNVRSLYSHFTEIELAAIEQTWSEHCKHNIFNSQLNDSTSGIYERYIKMSTNILNKRDLCVSVFNDNAGAIKFDHNYLITIKVETHNTPSALEPVGGAMTGILGVNRDIAGFGIGSKPISNSYFFCFATPKYKHSLYRNSSRTTSVLDSEYIMHGVIEGVKIGGNHSGIPTCTGGMYHDNRFVAKPLVFCGSIGIIPTKINIKTSHKKIINSGDLIIMAGGQVGKDGIHGATSSSVEMTEDINGSIVQIGDPFVQKCLLDATLEARPIINAITDNGAGGLSSSVGEMAEISGGFEVQIEKVPVKYPSMAPWEIWISESQERMTVAISPENLDSFQEIMHKHNVEATVIGKFTNNKKATITHNGEIIMNLDMDFLHNGNPQLKFTTKKPKSIQPKPTTSIPLPAEALVELISSPNIRSHEFITTQYDHEVQGNSVLKPIQGIGRVTGEASIIKPLHESRKCVVQSQGIFPRYGDFNPYHMVGCAIDTAICNVVACGADPDRVALLDNFCWCDSHNPERLWQLEEAARSCYDHAIAFATPFVSGKDSMFNNFSGYDKDGNPVKLDSPPSVLITSVGIADDFTQTVSVDAKFPGDLIYIIGETKDEILGSEFYEVYGGMGQIPKSQKNLSLYTKYHKLVQKNVISSCIGVTRGGLGIAITKKLIAGNMGAKIDLSSIQLDTLVTLFSETPGRMLVSINPQNKEIFENTIGQYSLLLGRTAEEPLLDIKDTMSISVDLLGAMYRSN